MFDTVFSGGTVLDGSGGSEYVADIGIRDGRVASIGDLTGAQAKDNIDIAGLAIAPGFIDLHTHSDFTLVVNGRAESQVHQGVTTEVVGQCGHSCAPLKNASDVPMMASGHAAKRTRHWTSFGEYLNVLEQGTLGVNVAAFVGHSTVHGSVMGDTLRAGDPDEIKQMTRIIDQALDEGAAGFSTGLEYWPGIMASVDQLVPLCESAANRGKLYATHVRNRDRYYDLGFGEAIAAARLSGARLQISHIQTKFGAPEYAMEHTLEMIDAARRHDVNVAFDVIPHDWNNTSIISILPKWVREGGTAATLERLKDPQVRKQVKENPAPMLLIVNAGRWKDIVLLNSHVNKDLIGVDFEEIGKMRGVDPYDAVMDMLMEEGSAAARLMWATRSFSDKEVELAMSQPDCAVISDTAALAPYGDLKDDLFSLSGYGWAARFLQVYVRDRKVLSLPQAIRKITSLPAERVGIKQRGCLRPGFWADVTVFDASQIASQVTVSKPREYARGISHVMVNGKLAMRDGQRTDSNAGVVLRDTGVR